MSYSRRSRYSLSPSPYKRHSRSFSRSPSRSSSRDSSDAENPGNNLYVTGLSTRVSRRDLEKHFSTEGKVEDVRLVVDPWTQESRGFGFVTMCTLEEANQCVKYLDRSVLQGRARRRRGRTPTPGRYLGLRTVRVRHGSRSYSRSVSPCYSPERERGSSRSYSPCYNSRCQQYSPSHGRRSYSPYYRRGRSYSRSRSPSYSRSPVRRRDRSHSPKYHSPNECYYRRRYRSSPETPDDYKYRRSRYRSRSQSISPVRRRYKRRYSRSISPRRLRRSDSHSISPRRFRRSYSRSVSPSYRRSVSHCDSHSSRSHSRSPSAESTSQSG